MILILLKQKKKMFCLKRSYDEEQSVFCKDFLFTPSLSIFNHVVLVEQMCFDKMCFRNHSAFLKFITQKSVQKDALCIWVFIENCLCYTCIIIFVNMKSLKYDIFTFLFITSWVCLFHFVVFCLLKVFIPIIH